MKLLVRLLAVLALPAATCTDRCSAPTWEADGEKWCLVQSARSIVTATLQQPGDPAEARDRGNSLDVRDGSLTPSAAGAFFNGTDNATENSTNENATYPEMKRMYDLSVSLWVRLAFQVCLHWQFIVVFFTLGFALIFPLLHWKFEHRVKERQMFNHNDAETGSSKGVVNMLEHIRVNKGGGLSRVGTLIEVDRPKPRRTIKVIAHVISITFNVFMLVQQDMTVLRGAVDYYTGDRHDALPDVLKRYLEFTGNTSLISVRHAACVALAELLGLAAMVIWIMYRLVVFLAKKESTHSKFDAFLALHEVFDGANLLGGFSALRLVSAVHPALIMRQFQWNMARPFLGNKGEFIKAVQFIYFVVTRFFAIFLGVLAFGVKLAFTSVQVHMPLVGGENWLQTFMWRWCVVVMLLEQTLGAIAVEHVMMWRVVLVVVEGGDRQITMEKIQIFHVYLSRVMQSIYLEFWRKGLYVQFFMLMLTFDHIDLQNLLIDERTDITESLTLGDDSQGEDTLPDEEEDLKQGDEQDS